VTFNVIFAWLLISLSLGLGISPIANLASNPDFEREGKIIVVGVSESSPAEIAGIKAGDVVYEISGGRGVLTEEDLTVQSAQEFIASSDELSFEIYRVDEKVSIKVVPSEGIVEGKKAVGISMETTALIQVPWYSALIEGAKTTYNVTILTATGLWSFVADAFTGKADYDQVSGPIGIVGLVDDASVAGFSYLLFFTAIISINLAVINILPFPALDGGRILFIIIETITRRPIPPKVSNTLNLVGFALLILLMVVVTYQDIIKIIVN
jgi:regulator of sigma E protease